MTTKKDFNKQEPETAEEMFELARQLIQNGNIILGYYWEEKARKLRIKK